jgi:hypothetical protein
MMHKGRRWFVLGACSALLAASNAQAADDSCSGKYAGARLLGNVLDLSLTADALKLLNGHENPKLKRLLEWRLVSAAADAKRQIDEGAVWENSPAVPNLAEGVNRAATYVLEHDLDEKPPVSAAENAGKPSENLDTVRKWLSKQS